MNRRDFLKAGAVFSFVPTTSLLHNEPVVEPKKIDMGKGWISEAFPHNKRPLKMWHNGVDTVIATDIQDARKFVAEQYYCKPCTACDELDSDLWGYAASSAPDKTLTPIYLDEVDGPDDWEQYEHCKEFTLWQDCPGNNEVTKTVREWINEYGRGYFACSEY